MNTPICDFVSQYASQGALRLHMPGHKGTKLLGFEERDITEIEGADSLYEAEGIIRESEYNASSLFGCPTFYSTEGSSQCIRAMLYLAMLSCGKERMRIAAGRNAHKTFLSAAALLDLDVFWLQPKEQDSYLSCEIRPEMIDDLFRNGNAVDAVDAVYITSPDYLGNTADIAALSEACRRHGALLIVDNAHGAYLKFLPESRHPIDLGADMCCDSAHKTLPVLTGGAYLHLSPALPKQLVQQAKNALVLFGSTSPSYLIMQSLDAVNAYIACTYKEKLAQFSAEVRGLKQRLGKAGFVLRGNEPMKITICARPYGYTGRELADVLLEGGIVCEFSDPDFLVMMLTPEIGTDGLKRLEEVLLSVPARRALPEEAPRFFLPEKLLSVREAMFSPGEQIPAEQSAGRVLQAANVGCPPAVPIVVSGERIDEHALKCFRYYGIENCFVVKE